MWKFALVEVCVEVENSISANDTVCTTGIVVPLSCDPPTADVGPEGSEPVLCITRYHYYSLFLHKLLSNAILESITFNEQCLAMLSHDL